MTYTIESTYKWKEYHYRFREQTRWSVSANPYGPFGFSVLGKLTLTEDAIKKYTVTQRMGIRYICENIPFVGMFVSNPYIFFSDGREVGKMCRRIGEYGYIGTINNIQYEYRLHSGYIWSLACDGEQVAIVKYQMNSERSYTVEFDAEGEKHLGILLLLCGCFDREDISNNTPIHPNYVPGDKYEHRALWHP